MKKRGDDPIKQHGEDPTNKRCGEDPHEQENKTKSRTCGDGTMDNTKADNKQTVGMARYENREDPMKTTRTNTQTNNQPNNNCGMTPT